MLDVVSRITFLLYNFVANQLTMRWKINLYQVNVSIGIQDHILIIGIKSFKKMKCRKNDKYRQTLVNPAQMCDAADNNL